MLSIIIYIILHQLWDVSSHELTVSVKQILWEEGWSSAYRPEVGSSEEYN